MEDPKEKENKEQMLKLTGIADEILTRWFVACNLDSGLIIWFRSGNMEIYEMTYEGILFKIKAEEEKKVGHTFKLRKIKYKSSWKAHNKVGKKATVPDNVDDDDALDMFAENLDGDKKKEEVAAAPVKEDPVLDDVSLGDNQFLYIFCGNPGELGVQVEVWGCGTAWASHQSKNARLAGRRA